MKNNNLFAILANVHFLAVKTQNYHWNVKGANFYQLHKMFEEQYTQMKDFIDTMAERIRTLGELVPTFNDKDNVIGNPNHNLKSNEMIQDLIESHKKLCDLIVNIDTKNDFVTDEILQDELKFHQKTIWFLTSSLV